MTDDVDADVYLDAAPVALAPETRATLERVGAAMAAELAGDASGHDPHHAWRVFVLATRLAVELPGDRFGDGDDGDRLPPAVDLPVLGAAALTHDLHRVRGEGYVHPVETLPELRELLAAAKFPGDVAAVEHAVAVHEEYAFRDDDGPEPAPSAETRRECGYDGPMEPATPEAELLQDADNLDATGAVGVARTFQFGGAHGTPMWVPGREVRGAAAYDRPDVTATTVDHVHEKLLRLPEAMNTDPARELAADRHEFLETFLDRFEAEWLGRR